MDKPGFGTRSWRFALLFFSVSAACALWACSGDDAAIFTGADGGDDGAFDGAASADGDMSDSGVGDGGSDSSVLACPVYTGTDVYCKALTDVCNRCLSTLRACDLQNVANCEQFSQVLSQNARKAVADCAPKTACGSDAGSRCYLNELSKDTPTAADQKLAQDYCNACPGAVSTDECLADFFFKPDGGGEGKFYFLMEFDDQIVGQIDTTCIPLLAPDAGDAGDAGALSCTTKFLACAAFIVQRVSPTDACRDAGR